MIVYSDSIILFKVIRDQNTGEILDFCEVENTSLLKVKNSQVSGNILQSDFNYLDDIKEPEDCQLDVSFDRGSKLLSFIFF